MLVHERVGTDEVFTMVVTIEHLRYETTGRRLLETVRDTAAVQNDREILTRHPESTGLVL